MMSGKICTECRMIETAHLIGSCREAKCPHGFNKDLTDELGGNAYDDLAQEIITDIHKGDGKEKRRGAQES